MENKKTKLTISGNTKKPIKNIELARNQNKNSVIIEKKTGKFSNRSSFVNRPYNKNTNFRGKTFSTSEKTPFSKLKQTPSRSNDYEKRKLAEQRATKRLKDDSTSKDSKGKIGSKKRELKLTVSRALSDQIEEKSRSMASIKRAKQKENLKNDNKKENFKPVKRDVKIPESITVRDLANRMAEQSSSLIKHLFGMGVTVTINQALAADTAEYLVQEFGHNPIRETKAEEIIQKIKETKSENLKNRPPIITVMGHVDHGKTSLLDVLRSANVVSGEFGGITQHIGAYQIDHNSKKLTFIDTPGHAAFSEVRARGANSTDIVILVVAADDGLQPQTEEAISHARAAEVPIVVAVNKMDREESDIEKVKTELSNKELIPEDWGGQTQFVPISALKGEGIKELLEAVSLEAEVLELKAHHKGPAFGVVLDSTTEKGKGAVATILVQKGTLKKGDTILVGDQTKKVRSLVDENGNNIDSAGPSVPASITGLDQPPKAGEEFIVVTSDKMAKEISNERAEKAREERLARNQISNLEMLFESELANHTILNIVLKADTHGSLEAIVGSLKNLENEEVKINLVHESVGSINANDLNLALTTDSFVIGFNVRADSAAKKLAEKESIDVLYYGIIYDLIDGIKVAIEGHLKPDVKEEILGTAEVKDIFKSPKFGLIAGSIVVEGTIKRNKPIRVLRDDIVIFEGELDSLKRFKDDANEVPMGTECGIGVSNYNDVQVGDKIEVFDRVEVKRTLD